MSALYPSPYGADSGRRADAARGRGGTGRTLVELFELAAAIPRLFGTNRRARRAEGVLSFWRGHTLLGHHITGRVIGSIDCLTSSLFSGTPPRRQIVAGGRAGGNTLPELKHPLKRPLSPGYGCNKRAAKAVKSGGSVDNTGDNYPLSKEKSPVGVESTLKNLKKRTKSTVNISYPCQFAPFHR